MSKKDYPVYNQVVFKKYNENQLMLPINLENLIPDSHITRVVNRVISQMRKAVRENIMYMWLGNGNHPVLKPLVHSVTEV